MEDDARSETSQISSSKVAVECPHCAKEFQTRAIFRHIRIHHFHDFITSTTTKGIEKAANGFALEVIWFKKNDFDEEEDITLYACLASNKTFMTEERANRHFAKSPKILKEHQKQMKDLVKIIKEAKEAKRSKTNAVLTKFSKAMAENNPEVARMFWRSCLFHSRGGERILKKCVELKMPDIYHMYSAYKHTDKNNLGMWVEEFEEKLIILNELKEQKCLNAKKLKPLAEYFELFNRSILTFLYNWEFDVFRHNGAQTVMTNEYSTEMYCIANDLMPQVDF